MLMANMAKAVQVNIIHMFGLYNLFFLSILGSGCETRLLFNFCLRWAANHEKDSLQGEELK